MKIVVGLSGGEIDSSVAAYLLKEQGHEVIGVFMRNWNDASVTLEDECPWIEDSNDALLVAEKLQIPFHVIDLSEQYKQRIVDYMFAEYKKGKTPNPDILCNREIKFDVFLDTALRLGADKIATGHYAQLEKTITNGNKTIYKLLAGNDINKDQSYFLCQLNQKQLAKSLFPIGHLSKPEVREIAKQKNLITADKKDSQGLCFIGHIKLPDFLQQQLVSKKGNVVKIPQDYPPYYLEKTLDIEDENSLIELSKKYHYKLEDGLVIGEHIGAHFFTIGQRKGLHIGGQKEPVFVIETDIVNNIIYVGEGKNHKGLLKKTLFIQNEDIHWVREDLQMKLNETRNYQVRIRYRQKLQQAQLIKKQKVLYIVFDKEISAITSGQFACWYLENELIGSGTIN